ncbi:MAG: NYN domain-containing protein [Pseudomonadota bacterium]
MTGRVAVFVDGENISADHADTIRVRAERHGQVDVLRVYGNAASMVRWHDAPGYRLLHSGTGKNATDILLVVDAMELALSGEFSTVVIASSDKDFLHLVLRLREKGLTVIGIGEGKAPPLLRAGCAEFQQLEPQLQVVAEKCPTPVAALPAKLTVPTVAVPAVPVPAVKVPKASVPTMLQGPALDRSIRDVIAVNSKNGQGMRIVDLSRIIHAQHGVLISKQPERNWRSYLAARPALFDLDPRGPEAKVRFKPGGFSQLT